MPWPRSTDYIEAVQNLPQSVGDEELRSGQFAETPLGLPMVWAGGFADVFKIYNGDTANTWALKCFTKEVAGQAKRYEQISAHLERVQLPFMVEFHYLEKGIRVRGEWYPVLKMRWVEGGIRLNEFVKQYLDQPKTLMKLLQLWVRMATQLRDAKVAHADLQHGNVLLVPQNGASLALKLIDYDGMYVPALAGTRSPELGHPAFQHPQRIREGAYSLEVDRFSHLVICTALHCLTVGGEQLWNRFSNDENLLFREQDFLDPTESELLRTLWALPDNCSRTLAARLTLACTKPLEQVPLLDEIELHPFAHAEGELIDWDEYSLSLPSQATPLAAEQFTEEDVLTWLGFSPAARTLPTNRSTSSGPAKKTPAKRWRVSETGWQSTSARRKAEVIRHRRQRQIRVIIGSGASVLMLLLGIVVYGQLRPSTSEDPPERAPPVSEVATAPVAPVPERRKIPEVSGPPERFTNRFGMDFQLVPAGEQVTNRETLSNPRPFYLSVGAVTREQYQIVMTGNSMRYSRSTLLPVDVPEDRAAVFCVRLSQVEAGRSYRLPTDAEWSYAIKRYPNAWNRHGGFHVVLAQ